MRRLALLGAAKGPWIDISRVQRPTFRVTGLKENPVCANIRYVSGLNGEMTIFRDGDHCLKPENGKATWIQFFMPNEKREPDLICEVVEQVA